MYICIYVYKYHTHIYIYTYTNIDSVEGWQVHFGCSLVVYIHVMFVRGPDQWQRSELRGCLEQVRR